jgi:hypothetical protein
MKMRMTIKRYVVISDLQVPFHDLKATANIAAFIKKWKPDEVLCVGDELDLPMLGKFNRGKPQEYLDDIGRDRDTCVEVLWSLGVTQLVRSNHQARLYDSISTRLPALLGLPELKYENFLRLNEIGVNFHRQPYQINKNWIMLHGDQQAIKPQGGLTALEAARRHGKSVVCGHTHRQGISAFTEASGGKLGRTLWGFEVGHLTAEGSKGMAYTGGTQNWQKGFGIMYVEKERVTPVTVPVERDGSFVVEGKRYG